MKQLIGSSSKHNVDGSENVTWKCNFAFLQSFFNYSKSLCLKKCVLTILELNWNQRLGHKKTKLNICHHMLTLSTQLQKRAFHVVERTRTSSKCQKIKNAKRAKILFFIVKYANLWGFLLPSSSWLLKLPNVVWDLFQNYKERLTVKQLSNDGSKCLIWLTRPVTHASGI